MWRAAFAVAACAVALGALHLTRRPTLRISTFNIENYGSCAKHTHEPRLVELLRDLDADVIAVQEIQDPNRFSRLVTTINAKGRRYVFQPSRCGGKHGMHVGFILDERRVHLTRTREFPELDPDGDGLCSFGDRAGLLGSFSSDAGDFDVLVAHLKATPEGLSRRMQQWGQALEIKNRRRDTKRPIAIVGDMNSTGFLDDKGDEKTFIKQQLATAGMKLPTETLACSEYFDGKDGRPYKRSLLDHIALSDNFPIRGGAEVQGYCRDVGCRAELGTAPWDFVEVSDHCPVSVGER